MGHEIGSNIGDVVAVVGQFRPVGITGFKPLRPRLRAGGQGVNLHPGIVVIKLAENLRALCSKQVANSVTQRRLPAMAHMKRPGWVGRYKLNHHALL